MRACIVGAGGFIASNLYWGLIQSKLYEEIILITRDSNDDEIEDSISRAHIFYFTAGVNRTNDPIDFYEVNFQELKNLTNKLRDKKKSYTLVYFSSTRSGDASDYGKSKKQACDFLLNTPMSGESKHIILNIPNVFGKWCRPNYNSVVATFCHNAVNGIPLDIRDPSAAVDLIYIDDLIAEILSPLSTTENIQVVNFDNLYRVTLGELADTITGFSEERENLIVPETGQGLSRALYATYLSHHSPDSFTYPLTVHGDERGVFAEIIRTKLNGQVSFFTADPGVRRGGHYHHTKSEKFLVVAGTAAFRFSNLKTGELVRLVVTSADPKVVITVPGWAHDIENIGESELAVLLWANELFDASVPDTYPFTIEG